MTLNQVLCVQFSTCEIKLETDMCEVIIWDIEFCAIRKKEEVHIYVFYGAKLFLRE
jgi:hypothetical protein